MTAALHILHTGYVGPEEADGMHVGSTVVYAVQGDTHVIVDPGLVAGVGAILDPLLALGVEPGQITDVVFSHQHIDHTLNAALFPNARFHDFAAIYHRDLWRDVDGEGRVLADDITLIRTPGHTNEDIPPGGAHRGGPDRVHPCVVVRGRPGRGPLRPRPGGAAPVARAHPRPRAGARGAGSRAGVHPCAVPLSGRCGRSRRHANGPHLHGQRPCQGMAPIGLRA